MSSPHGEGDDSLPSSFNARGRYRRGMRVAYYRLSNNAKERRFFRHLMRFEARPDRHTHYCLMPARRRHEVYILADDCHLMSLMSAFLISACLLHATRRRATVSPAAIRASRLACAPRVGVPRYVQEMPLPGR